MTLSAPLFQRLLELAKKQTIEHDDRVANLQRKGEKLRKKGASCHKQRPRKKLYGVFWRLFTNMRQPGLVAAKKTNLKFQH